MTEELIARIAIRQLVEDYALGADAADGERAAQLFTPDGVMHIHMDPARTDERSTTPASGMGRAWQSLREYTATSHLIGAHSATLTGANSATAVTTCVAHHVRDWPNGRTDTVMHIRYDDVLVRIDGRWLFEERTLRMKALATHAILD
jgi:hypothetical protein